MSPTPLSIPPDIPPDVPPNTPPENPPDGAANAPAVAGAAEPPPISREACLALDVADPLAPMREQFEIPPGLLYLDGNSLGVLPRATAAAVQRVIVQEWGEGLIRSWNTAGWIEAPLRIGNRIAPLVGAAPGELVAADSTSVNLYKVLSAAIGIATAGQPDRRVILSERSNFPTDLYIAQSLARQHGLTLELSSLDAIPDRLAGPRGQDVAVLMLTQVNYRSGRLADMPGLTAQAHAAGALTVWDLAHSAGALPVDLNGAGADFAVGCGYKYLNGGPGAPAFVWVHARHAARFQQPLSGWLGHAAPFAFDTAYRPAEGIARYLCGTPSVIGMAALECGVDTLHAAMPLGGLAALRRKSLALGELFIALVRERLAGSGLAIATPADPAQRGSQVSLACPRGEPGGAPALDGYAVMQALIARGVIGDFRAGAPPGPDLPADDPDAADLLRFGFTPLYTRFTDVFDAVSALQAVLQREEWRQPRFQARGAVT